MRLFNKFLFIILFSFIACNSQVKDNDPNSIKIGTFNVAWLGDGINDRVQRSEEDYERIANIISQINPDILGLEEIENYKAIERLTKYLPTYSYYISDNGTSQNLCFLYKKGLSVNYLGLYYPLAVDPTNTRAGAVLEAKKGNFDFIMMLVHLKSTSHYDSTTELKELSRNLRVLQAEVITKWADSILSLGKEQDIIIFGDFNDTPKRKNYPSLTPLINSGSLIFLTDGIKSCRFKNWYSIDHIIVSSSAKSRFIENSEFLYDFNSSLTDKDAEKISDHCPVTVRFEVISPDND